MSQRLICKERGMHHWTATLSFFSLAAAAPAAAQDPVTAFVNVAVIPMDRERVLPRQTVVVRGNRITALGPADRVAVPTGAVRVDGEGQYLMPGLADMHAHLGAVSHDTSLIADELFALIANGVTTLRDMHDPQHTPWSLLYRRRVAAGDLLGPRIYAAGRPAVSTPESTAASVMALKAAGYDFVKYHEDVLTDRAVYDAIMVAAHRVGLRVVGHATPAFGVDPVLQQHWASVEHLTQILDYVLGTGTTAWGEQTVYVALRGADAAWLRPGYRLDRARLRQRAEALRRAGVWNCPTLTQLLQFVRSGHERTTRQWFAYNLEIVKALHDAGAGLLLGTDWPGSGLPGFTIHRELELMVDAGLTPYQALATGTRDVARFLGTEDSAGTVAVGKRADLVLLHANPLVNIRHSAAIAGVMVGGRWLPRAELDKRLDAAPALPYGFSPDLQGTFRVQVRLARDLVWQ